MMTLDGRMNQNSTSSNASCVPLYATNFVLSRKWNLLLDIGSTREVRAFRLKNGQNDTVTAPSHFTDGQNGKLDDQFAAVAPPMEVESGKDDRSSRLVRRLGGMAFLGKSASAMAAVSGKGLKTDTSADAAGRCNPPRRTFRDVIRIGSSPRLC
jgi:hypothetical protein